ncbi:hypothetical protein BZG36_05586, partial [Bifiguratus adelaidae]
PPTSQPLFLRRRRHSDNGGCDWDAQLIGSRFRYAARIKEKLGWTLASVVRPRKERLSDEHRVSILKTSYGYTPDLGGEGGTTYMELSWKNDIFEGIEIKEESQSITRTETVLKLLDRIRMARFVVVQSPPMTGKTSLALLTERHLRTTHNESDLRVVRIFGAWYTSLDFDTLFRRVMGNTSWTQFVGECQIINTVFILDEAQAFYSSTGTLDGCRRGGQVFWEHVKQIQQGDRLNVIAFVAYGYDAAYGQSGARLLSTVSAHVRKCLDFPKVFGHCDIFYICQI